MDEFLEECKKMFELNCNEWEVIAGRWHRMDLYFREDDLNED